MVEFWGADPCLPLHGLEVLAPRGPVIAPEIEPEDGERGVMGGLGQEAPGVFGVKGRSASPMASTSWLRSQKAPAPDRILMAVSWE